MAAVPAIPGVSKFLGRFLGNSVSTAAGVAIGGATVDVLIPKLQSFKNDQWKANAHVPPAVSAMAEGVATQKVDATTGAFYASQLGIGRDQFDALVAVAKTYPTTGELLQLQRRTALPDGTFETAGQSMIDYLMKHGLSEADAGVVSRLLPAYLSPSEVANAIQQGHLSNPGILPDLDTNVTPAPGATAPTAPDGQPPSSVPLTQIGFDPLLEAEASGITEARLQVLANLAGLPPGQHELLQMWNRGLIDEESVNAGIREGHTKTKWIGPFKRLRWSVLSELQYVEARVRGWITNEQLYAGGALTGYTKEQLDLLHSTHGRPISARGVARGLARGGKRLDPVADFTGANPIAADGSAVAPIPDTLFKAMQQSNVQQQWYDIERHDIVNYPSLFMLNRLSIADPSYIPRAVTILGYLIYDPVDITAIEKYWNDQTGAGTAVKKETLSLLTQEYLSGVLSPAAFTTALGGLGYTAQQAADLIETTNFKAASTERTRNTKLIEKQYVALKISEAQARTDLAQLGWPAGVIDNKINAWNIERQIAVTTLTVAQIEKALKAGALTPADATPLLEDLGENAAAIATIIATNAPTPAPA